MEREEFYKSVNGALDKYGRRKEQAVDNPEFWEKHSLLMAAINQGGTFYRLIGVDYENYPLFFKNYLREKGASLFRSKSVAKRLAIV